MSDSPLAGMLGIPSFVDNVAPESWRAGLLRQEPNGTAPLTALTALMPSRSVDNLKYHFFQKSLPTFQFSVTSGSSVYKNAGLSTKYVSGGVANDLLFIKMTEARTEGFRADNLVLLRYTEDASLDVNAIVQGEPVKNGSSSYIAVRLIEKDDNSVVSPANTLAKTDEVLLMGSAHPDGSLHPKAVAYREEEVYNYLQIHRTALNLTGRKMNTKTRTVEPYGEAKLDAVTQHMTGIEWTIIFGERSLDSTGAYTENGEPRSTTRGIVNWIKNSAPDNVNYFNLDHTTKYAGKSWSEMGLEWLEEQIELSFRFRTPGKNNSTKLVYAGSLAILGIQRMVRDHGSTLLQVIDGIDHFGIKVMRLVSPFGNWDLQIHPLFSHATSNQHNMLVLSPVNLGYVYFEGRDTQFIGQETKFGEAGYDGKRESFFTDAGIEVFWPNTHMYLGGVGQNNTIAL